jgi:hypothetical protein
MMGGHIASADNTHHDDDEKKIGIPYPSLHDNPASTSISSRRSKLSSTTNAPTVSLKALAPT